VKDHPLRVHAYRLVEALESIDSIRDDVEGAAAAIASALSAGNAVYTAGNGGSAAEAQHLAGELVGRLSAERERGPLRAASLTGDASTMTALGNDYGFEQVFARQVAGLARPGDVLVVLSTSGASENLVAAVREAKNAGAVTVGLLGKQKRTLHELCDHVLAAPANDVATIQECHLALIHVLVGLVEDRLSGRS
jgi:phosphoheptose isomerase